MCVKTITLTKPGLTRYFLGLWVGFLLFVNANPLAAECSVLHLQKMHRSGVSVSNNHCSGTIALSLDSLIEIQSGTRLWLETANIDQNADNFQIVCQNQSAIPAKLKLASSLSPWLVPVNLLHCNHWENNRLTCNATGTTDTALLCVIAKKPSNKTGEEMALKTSLVMRKTNAKFATEIDDGRQWSELIKPGVDLCRKLVNSRRAITINWRINATGLVSAKSVIKPLTPADKQFADCALEAVKNTSFPKVTQEKSLTSMF